MQFINYNSQLHTDDTEEPETESGSGSGSGIDDEDDDDGSGKTFFTLKIIKFY